MTVQSCTPNTATHFNAMSLVQALQEALDTFETHKASLAGQPPARAEGTLELLRANLMKFAPTHKDACLSTKFRTDFYAALCRYEQANDAFNMASKAVRSIEEEDEAFHALGDAATDARIALFAAAGLVELVR